MVDRVEFIQNTGNRSLPGTWRWPSEDDQFANRRGVAAYVTCRQGHESSLIVHAIAADDWVTPSLMCPTSGCTEHVEGRLVGWSDIAAPVIEAARGIMVKALDYCGKLPSAEDIFNK